MAPIAESVTPTGPLLTERAFGLLGERGTSMVIIEFVMTSIAILLVINRLFVRLSIEFRPCPDDWTIISSMVRKSTSLYFLTS